MKYRYSENLPIQLQVWLATDEYTHSDDPNEISVTTLLRPVKSLLLSKRVEAERDRAINNGESSILDEVNKPDLAGVLKSRMGTAIHNSVESAWKNNYKQALAILGYTKEFIERIQLNPEPGKKLPEGSIPVFTEKRLKRKIGKYTISGELDFCFNYIINDLKTTTTYVYNLKDDFDHIMQMSIYRWIFCGHGFDIEDHAQINYIFTNWSQWEADQKPDTYPQTNPAKAEVELFSLDEVEKFIKDRILTIKAERKKSEPEMIPCKPEELWQDDSKFAYFSNPDKTDGRASKVFDNPVDAANWQREKGKGTVIERVGKIRRCNFCSGSSICTQKDSYIQAGLLEYTPC